MCDSGLHQAERKHVKLLDKKLSFRYYSWQFMYIGHESSVEIVTFATMWTHPSTVATLTMHWNSTLASQACPAVTGNNSFVSLISVVPNITQESALSTWWSLESYVTFHNYSKLYVASFPVSTPTFVAYGCERLLVHYLLVCYSHYKGLENLYQKQWVSNLPQCRLIWV